MDTGTSGWAPDAMANTNAATAATATGHCPRQPHGTDTIVPTKMYSRTSASTSPVDRTTT